MYNLCQKKKYNLQSESINLWWSQSSLPLSRLRNHRTPTVGKGKGNSPLDVIHFLAGLTNEMTPRRIWVSAILGQIDRHESSRSVSDFDCGIESRPFASTSSELSLVLRSACTALKSSFTWGDGSKYGFVQHAGMKMFMSDWRNTCFRIYSQHLCFTDSVFLLAAKNKN